MTVTLLLQRQTLLSLILNLKETEVKFNFFSFFYLVIKLVVVVVVEVRLVGLEGIISISSI